MHQLNTYEQKLLAGWEETYNKGQLSLWILLSLKAGPKYMSQIKEFILESTSKLVDPDDKSVYRALRRFRDSELIDYNLLPSTSGPDLKSYFLTTTGTNVLNVFLGRNIAGVILLPKNRQLIEKE